MSTFVYKVRDVRGIPAKGELDAESRFEVANELRSKGYTVVDINEKSGGTSFNNMLKDSKRIKSKNITVFSRQFATMINSGLAMLRALYILENQTQNSKLKSIIGEVRTEVEGGSALSDALEKHRRIQL